MSKSYCVKMVKTIKVFVELEDGEDGFIAVEKAQSAVTDCDFEVDGITLIKQGYPISTSLYDIQIPLAKADGKGE